MTIPKWIEQNNEFILKVSGAKRWHKKGFTGKGVKLLVVELGDDKHKAMVNSCKVLAPDTKVLQYQVTNSFDYERMLDYAIKEKVDIINTSFKMDFYEVTKSYKRVKQKLQQLIDANVLIFNSMGNYGDESTMIGENAFLNDDVINVGAVSITASGKKGVPIRQSYSSYKDKKLDCMGITGYYTKEGGYITGTSGASPYCAFLAALYVQKYGRVSPDLLLDKCTLDIGDKEGYDKKTGHGLFVLPIEGKLHVPMLSKAMIGVHRKYTWYSFKKGYKLR